MILGQLHNGTHVETEHVTCDKNVNEKKLKKHSAPIIDLAQKKKKKKKKKSAPNVAPTPQNQPISTDSALGAAASRCYKIEDLAQPSCSGVMYPIAASIAMRRRRSLVEEYGGVSIHIQAVEGQSPTLKALQENPKESRLKELQN